MEDHILLNIDANIAQFVGTFETLIIGALIGILISAIAYLAISVTGRSKGMTDHLL